jgi:cytochrome c peroxidase
LTELAKQGEAMFHREDTGCGRCHPGPLYTNLKLFNVGTRSKLDRADAFDTPTLVELWRTGPYLHDGSAATIREVLIDRNPEDKHGRTSHLTAEELEALIAYLRSL